MSEDFVYKSKKRDWACFICREAAYAFVRYKHKIYFEGLDRLQCLSDQPFILIPKHQHYFDIILEGVVLKKGANRNGHYIMKDELPSICDYMGGVRVVRTLDVVQGNTQQLTGKDRQFIRLQLKEARKRSKYVSQVINYLLNDGEVVVTHPEITRNYQQRGDEETVRNNLAKLLHLQRKSGTPTTFVPLDFLYEDVAKRRSRILVTVGNPIQVADDGLDELVGHMADEIKMLF